MQQLGARSGKGALVSNVESNGPADKAGIKAGDIIVEYNGQPVASNDDLVNRVVRTAPGTSVPVKVSRRGRSSRCPSPSASSTSRRKASSPSEAEQDASAGFGLTLQDLTPDIARQLRVPSGTAGAVVTEVEPRSPAARVGVTRGDVVLEVNRKPVSGSNEASREFQKVKSGEIATMLVLRGGQEVFVTMRKE